jgi:acetyltransferase-like isoleucine patch superfamily enzyme
MKSERFSKWMRLQEVLVTSLLGNLPTIMLGTKLRNWFYRIIFARIGKTVYIQEGVEFIGASCIEIGNGVYIFKGVRIDGKGHENNRIILDNAVAIERNTTIGCLNNSYIEIGEETFIGPDVCIAGPGNIKIGKRCLIAAHTGIFANNHNFTDPTKPIKYQGISCKGIIIENDCWLGHKVTVLDGVTIGEGCVIGAGAVVTKDIPPYSIAVGVPARVIKSRIVNKELVNSSD